MPPNVPCVPSRSDGRTTSLQVPMPAATCRSHVQPDWIGKVERPGSGKVSVQRLGSHCGSSDKSHHRITALGNPGVHSAPGEGPCPRSAVCRTMRRRATPVDRKEIFALICLIVLPVLWLACRKRLPARVRCLLTPLWAPIALLLGWGPLAATDAICAITSRPGTGCGMGFGMAWGMTMSFLSLVATAGFVLWDVACAVFRFIGDLTSRPKDIRN